MTERDQLLEYRKQIAELSEKEKKLRDLQLRKIARGEVYGPQTGYPSLDKPWLKWYSEESITNDIPKMKIYDYVLNHKFDNNIALEYMGKEITYKELYENVNEVSKAFKNNNVKPGDIVTIAMLNMPESIYLILALNKIGAIPSLIDPRTNESGIHKYLERNNSNFVFVTDLFTSKINKVAKNFDTKVVSVSLFSSLMPNYNKKNNISNKRLLGWKRFVSSGIGYNDEVDYEYKENTPAMVVHSGGSTGFPKGVVMTNENIISSTWQAIETGIPMYEKETWLGIMPPFIIYGASTGTILPLKLGMKIYLEPLFSPKKLPKILLKKKPVHMTLAPTHFENIISNKSLTNEDMSFIVAPTVGGDTMKIELEKETNKWLKDHNCLYKVLKGYGASETCSAVTVCISNECNKIGSVGIPMVKTSISIFDPDSDIEKKNGEYGEICVSGPTNMLKYFNEEGTEKITKLHSDGKLWVHTGDWGYMDNDGMVYITDRIKRMIVLYSGFKVLPSYVEDLIMQTGLVEDVCIVGVPDKNHIQGEIPYAFIVAKNKFDSKQVTEKIKKYLQENIKDNDSIPVFYKVVTKLPIVLSNGKIDAKTLKEMATEEIEEKSLKKINKKVKLY